MALVPKKVDKEFTWDGTEEIWGTTNALWTDEFITVVEKVRAGGSRGGVRRKQDMWDSWNRLNNVDKKKFLYLILTLKSGVRLKENISIKDYKVSVEDIEMVLDEYEKVRDKINIKIDDIKVR